MNRTQSERKLNPYFSDALAKAKRVIATAVLTAFIPAVAVAQYPGNGPAPSYGSKGAVIGGVAAGAAVGAGLLYWKFHSHSKLQGCVAGDGDRLVTEKDNQTYKLTNKQTHSLKAGQRVELLGKRTKEATGEPTFEVRKLNKELGQCTTTDATALKNPN